MDVFPHLDFVQRWFSNMVDIKTSTPRKGIIYDIYGNMFQFYWASITDVDNSHKLDPYITYYPVVRVNDKNKFVLYPNWMTMTKKFIDNANSYMEIMEKSSLITLNEENKRQQQSINEGIEVEIVRTIVKYGDDEPQPYAQIICNGKDAGFINSEGIYLKIWNSTIKNGTYYKLPLWKGLSYKEKCRNVRQYWKSIYDNYPLVIKK